MLVGRNGIGDALRRLDKLTQDEARMAAAQILMLAHNIDNNVTTVINGTSSVLDYRGSHLERACLV
jgi:hypothetical protein